MSQDKMNSRMSDALEMKVSNFLKYDDGFSFTVNTELEAYKAAHKYQFAKETKVSFAPNVNKWSVSVYN